MKRRVWAARAAIVVLGLGLVAGGASGDQPEGGDGILLNVTPSDNLPPNDLVTVTGSGFFAFEGTIPGTDTVEVHQCVGFLEDCGLATVLKVDGEGNFTGQVPAVRYLTLLRSATTIDCAEQVNVETGESVCEMWAEGSRFATHHLHFSLIVPTTTTKPSPTTTTTTLAPAVTTTTRRPTTTTTPSPTPTNPPVPTTTTIGPRPAQPGATIPPTTRVGQPTTTVRGSVTSTTAPTTTTTTTTIPPDLDAPTLVAVTSRNRPAGPPGGGLQVQGSGYTTCSPVYFFFDGTRVGSDTPDAAGNVSKGGLSVPGDAGDGPHQVTASCDPEGSAVVQASTFEVLPVAVHRPAFVTSLPLPSQVSLDPMTLLASGAFAAGAIMLLAFPYELFNSTMEENYDEIRGWFGMGPRGVPEPKTRSNLPTFFGFTALSAVVLGFLSPDFGLNRTSVVLFIGMFVALLVMAVVFSLPADIGIRRQFGEWGKLNFLPGTVLVSIVLVLLSRLFAFQPGYFYGALAGLAFRSALSEKVQGRMTAYNWLFSLAISVGAFFLRVPVSAAAAEEGRSIWWIGLEICLALIFLWGVEGLAVAMLPMKFLDGRKVFRWSRTAWAVLFFLGVFATVHVLLRPGSGYVGSTSGEVSIGVMTLLAVFGLVSMGLWAYFRFRPERWIPAKASA